MRSASSSPLQVRNRTRWKKGNAAPATEDDQFCPLPRTHAGSSEAAVLANTTIPSYNGTYDLDGALPNAFVNMTCVDASGSYDKVAPFMDAFLDGLRIDSVILAAWALLFLVHALHARAPQHRQLTILLQRLSESMTT